MSSPPTLHSIYPAAITLTERGTATIVPAASLGHIITLCMSVSINKAMEGGYGVGTARNEIGL